MSAQRTTINGEVLPGPTITPPYVSDIRCVVWVAGRDEWVEDGTGGAVPFRIALEDGREIGVEPAGAGAVVPVRVTISFDRLALAEKEIVPGK